MEVKSVGFIPQADQMEIDPIKSEEQKASAMLGDLSRLLMNYFSVC